MLQSGRYWISSKNVPKSNGYYRDNKDGTFTKVANRTDVDCQDRLHVSAQAAAKVAADEECPLLLIVRGVGFESDSRLDVVLIEWTDDDARVAYVSIA